LLVALCAAHFFIRHFSLQFNDLHQHDASVTDKGRTSAKPGASVDVPTRMARVFADD
jgi:hypothetical protein